MRSHRHSVRAVTVAVRGIRPSTPIDYLLEWSVERPVFLLALGRPELLDSRPDWAASAITLAPLPDAAMRELLDGLVPGLPDDLSLRVLSRAERMPLSRRYACCSTAVCSNSRAAATA